MRARLISLLIHAVAIAALLLLPFGESATLDKPVEPALPPIRLHIVPPPAPAPHPGGGNTRNMCLCRPSKERRSCIPL